MSIGMVVAYIAKIAVSYYNIKMLEAKAFDPMMPSSVKIIQP